MLITTYDGRVLDWTPPAQAELNAVLDKAVRISDCIDPLLAAASKNDMPLVKRKRERRIRQLRHMFCRTMGIAGGMKTWMANAKKAAERG